MIPWGIFTQFAKDVYTETKLNGLILWERGYIINYYYYYFVGGMGPFWPMFLWVWVNLGNLLQGGRRGEEEDEWLMMGGGVAHKKKSSEVRIPVNFQALNQNQTCLPPHHATFPPSV